MRPKNLRHKNLNAGAIIATPKRQLQLRKNTSYDVLIVKIGPPFFLHKSVFYPSSKILCFTMLFNRPDTPKVIPFLWGHLYIPIVQP